MSDVRFNTYGSAAKTVECDGAQVNVTLYRRDGALQIMYLLDSGWSCGAGCAQYLFPSRFNVSRLWRSVEQATDALIKKCVEHHRAKCERDPDDGTVRVWQSL
jgi:hypothetical protein